MEFMPSDISLISAVILVIVAFIGSAISAGLGIGGGITFITVLASVAPASAVIPIHGFVQLGSNFGRATVQRAYINWPITTYFILGSIIGVAIGGNLALQMPENLLKILLAIFILYSIWGPLRFSIKKVSAKMLAVSGLISAFLTMFIGATGPFVISVLAPALKDRRALFGTHAVCMVIQHSLKILVFGFLGFSYVAWLPLLFAMIISGYFGTLLGSHITNWLPEESFRKILRIILTVLAANLLVSATVIYI
jgi:uncharacterized membrane protein YfcA|tara:strand:+ start:5768 stop:6523 length:756 start_codon:yes stop_codon:yes gene_type:complete